MINSSVRTKKHKEAIIHDTEPHIWSWETFVTELILKKNDFPIVSNRVVLSKHFERNRLLWLVIKTYFMFTLRLYLFMFDYLI